MRKILLLSGMVLVGMLSNAQLVKHRDINKMARMHRESSTVYQHHAAYNPHQGIGRSTTLTERLHSQRVGSAGNLLTIIEGTCNQLDVNDSLNAVTFIHRNDPTIDPSTNVAQYRFDISKDRGNNWITDIGPITVDPSIDNVGVNGRFPQAVIYSPAGTTSVDSAYLVYAGTWHDNNTWAGQMRGRGKLSGDLSTFNVHIDDINNKHVAIAGSMCQSTPGVFWNINRDYTATFNSGPYFTDSFFVEKGVWNAGTGDVDWTYKTIPERSKIFLICYCFCLIEEKKLSAKFKRIY